MRGESAAYVAVHKPKPDTAAFSYSAQKAGIANATPHLGKRNGLSALTDREIGVRVLIALA
jgi:hypothetical protein